MNIIKCETSLTACTCTLTNEQATTKKDRLDNVFNIMNGHSVYSLLNIADRDHCQCSLSQSDMGYLAVLHPSYPSSHCQNLIVHR